MNCPKCKSPIAANARFCGTCGQPVPAALPAVDLVVPAGGGSAGAAAWSAPPAAPVWPGLLQRIGRILLSPREEWPVIAPEPTTPAQLYSGYVIPLAVVVAVASFISRSLIGVTLPFVGQVRVPIMSGLLTAALTLVAACLGVFLVGLIINLLAPTFGGTRDQRQAVKCAAYSLTPGCVGAVLGLSPILSTLLQLIAGCYGIYVLALGLPVMMRSPKERAVGYTATVVICTILMGVVISMASVALGLAGHATGLMGSPELSREQGATEVGNAIGNMLGTDAKGKAGISAAIDNLAKAGEQQAAANAAAAQAQTSQAATTQPATGAATASASGNAADTAASNPGAAVGGLMTALGGALGGDHPVAVVDFHALTALLPATAAGLKRTDARGESQGAMGVKSASATGTYQGDNGAHLTIEITDMSAVSGLMGLAGSLGVQNTTSESASGYERDQTVNGRTVHETFETGGKHGVLTTLVAKRFQVEITGNGLDMGTLEQSLGTLDLGRLEAMKDQGGPAH